MQELFAKFKRDIRKKKKKKDISLGNLYVRVWALKGQPFRYMRQPKFARSNEGALNAKCFELVKSRMPSMCLCFYMKNLKAPGKAPQATERC